MWLEADCNVTSGESLARQFLYGIRFIEEEFGKNAISCGCLTCSATAGHFLRL